MPSSTITISAPSTKNCAIARECSARARKKTTGSHTVAVLIRKRPDGLPEGYRLKLSEHGAFTAQAATPLGAFDVILVPESKTTRLDRWVDQNIRQLVPVSMSGGFSYVIARQTGSVIPIISTP